MLGVMTVRKEELKFREFDRYRGFYCGLCRAIGQRCGKACRMALSFEMTFLSMLLTSLYEPQTSGEMRRCAFHPIEKRLACAAQGDFALALYNPSSKGRPDYLRRAVDILLANGKAPDTLCGSVRNIGREGQEKHILTLSQLRDTEVDMFTTVFVGNAATRALSGRMVTPRGYRR